LRALRARDDRVIALVPGERAPLHRVTVPGRSARLRRRALPYALEERLSEDLENLRIVAGPGQGEQMTASVAALRDVRYWLDWLEQHAVRPDHLIADIALLRKLNPDAGGIMLSGSERSIVLLPASEPMAMPSELATWWRERQEMATPAPTDTAEPGAAPAPLEVLQPGTDRDAATPLQPPPEWNGEVIDLLQAAVQNGSVAPATLARSIRGALAFDLKAPEAGSATPFEALPPGWRLAAGLTAAVAAVWLGSVWLETGQLQREYRTTERAITEVFEQTLPGTRLVDPIGQFETRLRQDGDAGEPAPESVLGDVIAGVVSELASRELRLQNLRGDRERVELEIEGSGIAAVEALRESLRAAMDARVRIASAETGDTGVRARLVIEVQR
jgi:general secretion pathway protein L